MTHHHHPCPVHSCPVHGHAHQHCTCGGGCTCSHGHECSHDHDQQDFAIQLIEMADQAWMEVLKDKIKEHVQAASTKNLDELAKLVADANHERWKTKMAKEKGRKEFREKVTAFFNK